jgi:hypothetical protein
MAGGHPSTPRSRDFMSRNGTPAKRTFSISLNDPIRWIFVRFMPAENLDKIFSLPLFEGLLILKISIQKAAKRLLSPCFLHDYILRRGGIYSPLSSPDEIGVSDSGK